MSGTTEDAVRRGRATGWWSMPSIVLTVEFGGATKAPIRPPDVHQLGARCGAVALEFGPAGPQRVRVRLAPEEALLRRWHAEEVAPTAAAAEFFGRVLEGIRQSHDVLLFSSATLEVRE